ncbi:MAG: tetratricopeptide repeat protein, partial [Alphaproteobacteria bacterium]|nr:tetratricopeptide repeat protein [Alphaproteobacteria bacterium]
MTNLSELIERGRTFYAAGELGAALDYFERVLAADPTHRDATMAAGKIALEARRFDRAEKHFASALRDNPKTLAVSLARVRALRELQRTSEARTLLREIVRDHGERPDFLEQLAECDHLLV